MQEVSSKARLVEEGFLGRKVRMEKGVKANGSQKVGRKAERQTKGLKHGSLHTPRLIFRRLHQHRDSGHPVMSAF